MLLRDSTPLFAAFVASIAIHLAAIPYVINKGLVSPFAPPPDASHLETPLDEKPVIVLGIDQSAASTLTWIGYDQYQKHLARLAPVEQAAKQLEALPPVTSPKTTPPEIEDLAKTNAPIVDGATKLLDALRNLTFSFAVPTPKRVTKSTREQEKNTKNETTQVAELSELESDPTSIVEVPRENWKTGRPIAAEGIILRPRRPSFTAHQSVTSAPRGLRARLEIDHRGRPIKVEVITGTGSGSIDRSLVASLYRWRAAGEKIDALAEEKTLSITIHISFSK